MVGITIGQKPEHDYSDPIGMLSDCHRRLERFLDGMITIVNTARGAPLVEDQQKAMQAALRYFREAGPRHTADEEVSLFPRMRASDAAEVRDALSTLDSLDQDHKLVEPSHHEVETLVQRWISEGKLSKDAEDRLAELLENLRATYRRHIALEDNEVFRLAGKVLSPADLAAVGQEMADRRGVDSKTMSPSGAK